MYHTGVVEHFSARHHLLGDFPGEAEEHAHDYRVEWRVTVADLDNNGFAVDIDVLAGELRAIVRRLDGAYLNELEYFCELQPSVELLARHIHELAFAGVQRARVDVSRITEATVTLWESETAWAAYTALPA